MSAIYQPQNVYCISVDGTSSADFQKGMALLADCLPNVFIIVNLVQSAKDPTNFKQTPSSPECSFQRVRSMVGCLKYVNQIKHNWKQFIVKDRVEDNYHFYFSISTAWISL